MATSTNQIVMKHMQFNGQKVKRWIHNGVLTYIAGSTVTYICNGSAYTEEVDSGADCLSPKTFTPAMAGATFKGWSNSPDSTQILTSLTMGDEPITLYAVFKIADSIKYLSFDIQEYSKVISTTGTYHSIYTGVDKSLYSGAKLALSYMDAETHYAYSRLYLRFTDRSVSAQIANVYNDGETSSIVSSNLNPAITFANATGTANLSLLAISAGTGAGYEGSTQADYVLQGGTLTLIGRTIVSSAVEEEPANTTSVLGEATLGDMILGS
ncbi:MAG: hypothetical protein E7293_03435 [Lachnospiraceae bacterium]|nr:hypothetical protein [Lachnospiraceae bacterium]